MNAFYSKEFVKHFKTRIKPHPLLLNKFNKRISLFLKNPSSSLLKDHKLVGRKIGFRAFSITGDVRVIYAKGNTETIIFIDVGTHNQVYS